MAETKASRNALAFIFITILLDTIGFGIVIPVLPKLIVELSGEGLGRAAVYGGWLLFLYALMQFFFAPVLGNLSDRFGRRPALLFSLFAFAVDYLIMGLAPSLAWLFVGRTLSGIAGATVSTAGAYIADVSPPEKRAQNFGVIGAAFGVGFILGPVIGGLVGTFGSRVPFFAAAGLVLLHAVYGLLVIPESLPPEQRRPFSLQRANPVGTLFQMRQYPVIIGMFGVMLFFQLAHDSLPSTWNFYTMLKFSWSEREIGYSLGATGVLMAIVQGGLIRPVMGRLGERRSVYLGFSMMAVGFLGYAFAPSSWVMYAFMLPFALGSIAGPALRGLMSNQVPANAQGELQGATTSLQSLTAIVGPLLMTQLFGYFTSASAPLYFPGASFGAAGLLVLVGLVAFARVRTSAPSQAAEQESLPRAA